MKPLLILTLALGLVACREDADELPGPLAMTDEALGHYCQMYLADHPGPKAQVFVEGYAQPFWFSQVGDAAAFRADREKPAAIVVTYVSDMGRAESWGEPGIDNWIAAETAHFVIGSRVSGGMGLPEAVPFASEAAAQGWAAENGGRVVAWAEVPDDLIRRGALSANLPHQGHSK